MSPEEKEAFRQTLTQKLKREFERQAEFPSISSVRKLERAQQHIDHLTEMLKTYIDLRPLRWTLCEEGNCRLIELKSLQPIPSKVPMIIGDAVNNMRAALDHVMFRLINKSADRPKDIAFPFPKSGKAGMAAAIKKVQADKAGGTISETLNVLEPYEGANYLLHALNVFDNKNKHCELIRTAVRMVLPSSEVAKMLSMPPPPSPSMGTVAFQPGTTFEFALPLNQLSTKNSKIELPYSGKTQLVFADGEPLANFDVIEMLQSMKHMASASVSLIYKSAYDRSYLEGIDLEALLQSEAEAK